MLQVGARAPEFSVPDESRTLRSLREFAGKTVVLWFYPMADTPGCTAEGCGFRDRIRDFEALGAVILGASFDPPEKNRQFKEQHAFPFPLLCDTDRALGLAYGACDAADASCARRISVVIGPDGNVLRLYPTVKARIHPEQVLEDLTV